MAVATYTSLQPAKFSSRRIYLMTAWCTTIGVFEGCTNDTHCVYEEMETVEARNLATAKGLEVVQKRLKAVRIDQNKGKRV